MPPSLVFNVVTPPAVCSPFEGVVVVEDEELINDNLLFLEPRLDIPRTTPPPASLLVLSGMVVVAEVAEAATASDSDGGGTMTTTSPSNTT